MQSVTQTIQKLDERITALCIIEYEYYTTYNYLDFLPMSSWVFLTWILAAAAAGCWIWTSWGLTFVTGAAVAEDTRTGDLQKDKNY